MNKASAHCVETPELALSQKQPGDASVVPGSLTIRAERQGSVSSCGEPLALHSVPTFAEGCTGNASSQMLLDMHYTSPDFFLLSFSLIFFFSQKVFLSDYVDVLQQELSLVYMSIQHKCKEHLVSDKDTVAKQIKSTDRRPKYRESYAPKTTQAL